MISRNSLLQAKEILKRKKENNINTKYINYQNNKEEIENTILLDINIKLKNDKIIHFKLGGFGGVFKVVKENIIKNRLSENFMNFFAYNMIKESLKNNHKFLMLIISVKPFIFATIFSDIYDTLVEFLIK